MLGAVHPQLPEHIVLVLVPDFQIEERVRCLELSLHDHFVGAILGGDVHWAANAGALCLGADSIAVQDLQGAVADDGLVLHVPDLLGGLLGHGCLAKAEGARG